MAELLVALVILGVIATFTIPKVLQSQQDARYTAIADEAFSAVAVAYRRYQLEVGAGPNTHISDLTPYLNYVKIETTGTVDRPVGQSGIYNCSASYPCLVLHSGAKIYYYPGALGTNQGNTFGVANDNHYIWFIIDPNGVGDYPTATTGVGKSVDNQIYFNGRAQHYGDCKAGVNFTYDNGVQEDWC